MMWGLAGACDLNQDEVLGSDYTDRDATPGADAAIATGGTAGAAGGGGASGASAGGAACDLVPTPGGPAPRACVHEVPNGAEVSLSELGETVVKVAGKVVAVYPPCPCSTAAAAEHFIVDRGCERKRYGPDYVIEPQLVCAWRSPALQVRDCAPDRIDCQRSDQCNAQPFGHCAAYATAVCQYPLKSGPCLRDADCNEAPYGTCYDPMSSELFCYPNGECKREERRCAYRGLESDCTSDADCTALPLGVCKKRILNTRCEYQACNQDQDCGTKQRCACEVVNEAFERRVCVPAECSGDGDCAPGARCLKAGSCGGDALGDYCTTAVDECGNDDDCRSNPGAQGPDCAFSDAERRCTCQPIIPE